MTSIGRINENYLREYSPFFRVISFIWKVFCGIHVETNMQVTPQSPITNLVVRPKMVLSFTELINNCKQKQEKVIL